MKAEAYKFTKWVLSEQKIKMVQASQARPNVFGREVNVAPNTYLDFCGIKKIWTDKLNSDGTRFINITLKDGRQFLESFSESGKKNFEEFFRALETIWSKTS